MDTDDLQELTTGIEEIDQQHREFLRRLANLRDALGIGIGGRDRLMNTLRYLEEYISVHFDTEERWMRLRNYPGILLHQKEHAVFADRFADLKRKILDLEARGEIASLMTIEVDRRLEDWLRDHILTVDRKLAEFLAEPT